MTQISALPRHFLHVASMWTVDKYGMCVYVGIYLSVHVNLCVCGSVYICESVCVCVPVCMCTHRLSSSAVCLIIFARMLLVFLQCGALRSMFMRD